MFWMKVNINIAAAAIKNSMTTGFISKCFDEKESMPCAIIFGINMLTPLPISAIIINSTTIPEYGFSKLNIPGFGLLSFEEGETGPIHVFIRIILQRNSIKPIIHSKNR